MPKLFFVLKLLFISLFAFCVINVTTSKFEAYFDGMDRIGYPFRFYQSLGGKCLNCDTANFLKIHYLILDFAIVLSVVLLLFFLYEKMK